MTYRETSTQTVAARDVPLDPLGDSTQTVATSRPKVGFSQRLSHSAITPTPVR